AWSVWWSRSWWWPRLRLGGGRQSAVIQQVVDAGVDGVADAAQLRGGCAVRVGCGPVQVAAARDDGAGVAAAQGDDDVGRLDDLLRQRLGVGGTQVGPHLAQHP